MRHVFAVLSGLSASRKLSENGHIATSSRLVGKQKCISPVHAKNSVQLNRFL
jgi:hypothetical protein